MSTANRIRARKMFTLHPEVIEELRWLAESDNTSMSRKLEQVISAHYRQVQKEMDTPLEQGEIGDPAQTWAAHKA